MKKETISARSAPFVDESQDQISEENPFKLPQLTSNNEFIDLKDLDKWDEQHAEIKNQTKNCMINTKASNLVYKSSLMSLNYKNNMNSELIKIKTTLKNNSVNDFYRNIQQETSSLLVQNINIGKKRFDFDIFRKTPISTSSSSFGLKTKKSKRNSQEELYQLGNELAVRKRLSSTNIYQKKYNTLIDNDQEISIQNRILKRNDLKIEGQYKNVLSSEYYKEIVKDKNSLEKSYRKEIKVVSRELEALEKDVNLLNNELKALYNQIEDKKRMFYDNRDVYNIIDKEMKSDSAYKKEFVQQAKDYELNKRLKSQLDSFEEDYKQQKVVNRVRINRIKTEITNIKIGIRTLQEYKKSIIKQLIDYYFQILHDGVDVRSFGLSWVLIRIYEFGVNVSSKSFPKFLEHNSINYLMEYSKLAIIKKKLDVVLRLLVNKYLITPKREETKLNEEITHIGQEYSLLEYLAVFILKLKQKFKNNSIVTQNELIMLKDKEILQKSMNQLKELAGYQNLLTMESNLKKSEEDNDESIRKRKRKKDCDSFEETKEDINVSNSNKNKVRRASDFNYQKEIVEACGEIRIEIKKIDNEMKLIKERHMKYFKLKHENSKTKGISECIKYDLMYCALFGNYAVV